MRDTRFASPCCLPRRTWLSSITSIYVVLVLIGVVRSFNSTASRSILPQLVPQEHFPNAVAWNASIFQAATILGPSFGGIVYAAFHGPSAVYLIAMITGDWRDYFILPHQAGSESTAARAHDDEDRLRRPALHLE